MVHQLSHLLLKLWNVLALISSGMMQNQLCYSLTLKKETLKKSWCKAVSLSQTTDFMPYLLKAG